MESLADLGFRKNMIMETLVSTYGSDRNEPNAAPMGVITKDMRHLIIRPYLASQTYANLKDKKCAVVNVTSDPELYYHTALKDSNSRNKINSDWFEKAQVVNAPRLRMADAFIEVSVIEMQPFGSQRSEVVCNVEFVTMKNMPPKVYCRGIFACIEAIIHATRVKVYLSQGKRQEAQRLIELIGHYYALVDRVAPQSTYSQLMSDLAHRIDSWRAQYESLR